MANSQGYAQWQESQPLSVRLRAARPDDPVPAHLLRKYIAYARQYAHPTLSAEAAAALREFYLTLRKNGASAEASVPITSRQLESLVRLAEARARLELREVVTKADALDAIAVVTIYIYIYIYVYIIIIILLLFGLFSEYL